LHLDGSIPSGNKNNTTQMVFFLLAFLLIQMGLRPMGISHGLKIAHPQFCPHFVGVGLSIPSGSKKTTPPKWVVLFFW